MAARRLVIIMVVLLVVSTAAAVLIPQDPGGDDEPNDPPPATGTTGATGAAEAEVPPGAEDDGEPGEAVVEARVDASAKRPKTVAAAPGDRVVLRVAADTGVDVAIPRLGLYGTATEHAPALFDVLVREPGRFPVRVLGASRPAGLLSVERAGPSIGGSTRSTRTGG